MRKTVLLQQEGLFTTTVVILTVGVGVLLVVLLSLMLIA